MGRGPVFPLIISLFDKVFMILGRRNEAASRLHPCGRRYPVHGGRQGGQTFNVIDDDTKGDYVKLSAKLFPGPGVPCLTGSCIPPSASGASSG